MFCAPHRDSAFLTRQTSTRLKNHGLCDGGKFPAIRYHCFMREVTASAIMLVCRLPSEVFEAFADPDIMTKFWFPRASGKLETGREIKWYAATGRVITKGL